MIQHSYSWIYTQRKLTEKETCTTIFTAALFTKATTWKQRKGPWTDEWIKMIWCKYTHTRQQYLAIKRSAIFAATWMDLEIILREIRQICHLHVESKVWYEWTYLQNRNRLTDTENIFMVTRGKQGGGIN